MEDAPSVDDDGLAGHGLGAAHGDHHVGAVVLVGWPLQERARRGALDLLGPEVGCRASALQQTRRHAYISALLRIPHLVVCVNKMDLVGYDEAVFERIVDTE